MKREIGRIQILRKKTDVVQGRRQETETEQFYSCWCEIQSLSTTEKYSALQAGLENTIVFKVRRCQKTKEIRKKLKEFYAKYDGTEFKIYDASTMFKDRRYILLKCRAVE